MGILDFPTNGFSDTLKMVTRIPMAMSADLQGVSIGLGDLIIVTAKSN